MTKVIVSYACELEDIPRNVCELLSNLKESDLPLAEVDLQDAILYSNESNISEAMEAIDEVRAKLAKIDLRLLDCTSILAGYSKTNADIRLEAGMNQLGQGTQEVSPMDILKSEGEEDVNPGS